jgi:hypothetical protein
MGWSGGLYFQVGKKVRKVPETTATLCVAVCSSWSKREKGNAVRLKKSETKGKRRKTNREREKEKRHYALWRFFSLLYKRKSHEFEQSAVQFNWRGTQPTPSRLFSSGFVRFLVFFSGSHHWSTENCLY